MDQLKSQPPQDTKLHFLDYWRIIRIRKTVILAVFVLVVLTATVVTIMLPPKYQSTARIKVERDQADISGLNTLSSDRQMLGGFDPYFILTEFEVIQSEVILSQVATNGQFFDPDAPTKPPLWRFLGPDGRPQSLQDRWSNAKERLSAQGTMERLRRSLDVRQTRMTSLIEIIVRSYEKDEARDIANAIALTYQTYRVQERKRLTLGGIGALTARLEDVKNQVEDQQKVVDRLRVELQIPDSLIQADAPSQLVTQDQLRRILQIQIEGQAELDRQKKLLEELKSRASNPEELAQVIPTSGIQDTLLTTLLENLALTEQKLVSLKQEFGPAHSEVLKYSAQVDDLKNKVKERVAGFLSGLEAKVAGLEESLKSTQTQVEKYKAADIAEANRGRPYWEAKRKLDELQRFRNAVYIKMESEVTDL